MKKELSALKGLKDDHNIVIVKPDKGNGVLILNRDGYNKKIEDILADSSKFKCIAEDPVKLTIQ